MKTFASFLLGCVLLLTGCLELVGQRIGIHYDAAKDELRILIHYDGIHDSGNQQFGDGAGQLTEAIADGNILIMDWPLHFPLKKIVAAAADQNLPQEVRDFVDLLPKSVEVTALGWYRDPQERIGGAQLVTVRNAKTFIAKANAAISAGILQMPAGEPEEIRRSVALIRKAAKDGHTWLSLDGYSLKVSLPVHRTEWARVKAKGMKQALEHLFAISSQPPENADGSRRVYDPIVRGLTCLPINYSETDGGISLTLGDSKAPSTIRLENLKDYKPNLEKAVQEKVQHNLDDVMLPYVLGHKVRGDKHSALVASLLPLMPPEERVRSLMRAVRGKDAKTTAEAVKKLEDLAEEWNEKEGFPTAPKPGGTGEEYLDRWATWYREMIRFPLGSDVILP